MKYSELCWLSIFIGLISRGACSFTRFSSGDSFITQDVRVTRRLNIRESLTLSVIGEGFNVLNIANLSGFNNVLNQVNYGQPSARAGQVFGSGGPRTFQFATRLQF
jgi:hypothetical protein